MAKSSSFFGLRSGSTKSLTFQVMRGQQITKDRVSRVANPRSEAQMAQRALIPIVAAARKQLKGIVDHSFEGIAYGEASLREFSKINLRAGALTPTSFSPNGVSNAGFANLQVSKGSINGDFMLQQTGTVLATYGSVKSTYPRFSLPAALAGDPATAILSYLEQWGKNNNAPLLMPGTQLTFLTIFESGTVMVKGVSGEKEASLADFAFARIMIPNSETGQTELSEVNGSWKVKEEIGEGSPSVTLVNNDGDELMIACGMATSQAPSSILLTIKPKIVSVNESYRGGALILSRYENGVWKRSSATINIGLEPKYKYTFDDWLSVYQTTGVSSKKYLNAGVDNTGIQG